MCCCEGNATLPIPPSGIEPGAVNTVLWTGAGPAVSWSPNPRVSGSLAIGAIPSLTGAIRLANTGAVVSRNAANSADLNIINLSAANIVTVGQAGVSTSIVSSVAVGTTGQFGGNLFWTSGALTPSLTQLVDSTATIVGDTLTIGAQNVSGNTVTTGGMLFEQGGDATGTGGTHTGGAYSTRGGNATGAAGVRTGGDWLAEPGSGATADGSLRLRNAASADRIVINTTGLGFFATAPVAQQTIVGSRATGAALADLLTKLALTGLIVDGSGP